MVPFATFQFVHGLRLNENRNANESESPKFLNFSPMHLLASGFAGTVRHMLDETGLDSRFLEMEVTESLLVAASEQIHQVITALKDIGVSISVDDFGTGFSALSCL